MNNKKTHLTMPAPEIRQLGTIEIDNYKQFSLCICEQNGRIIIYERDEDTSVIDRANFAVLEDALGSFKRTVAKLQREELNDRIEEDKRRAGRELAEIRSAQERMEFN